MFSFYLSQVDQVVYYSIRSNISFDLSQLDQVVYYNIRSVFNFFSILYCMILYRFIPIYENLASNMIIIILETLDNYFFSIIILD